MYDNTGDNTGDIETILLIVVETSPSSRCTDNTSIEDTDHKQPDVNWGPF